MKQRKKIGFVQGLALGLSASSLITWAAVTIPNTFVADTTISADAVNANFTALATAINNMQIGFSSSLSVNQTITCGPSMSAAWPGDYELLNFENDEGGAAVSQWTAATNGLYRFIIHLGTGDYNFNRYLRVVRPGPVNEDIHFGSDGQHGEVVTRLQAGDVVEVYGGCGTKSGTEVTIESAKAFYSIRKL